MIVPLATTSTRAPARHREAKMPAHRDDDAMVAAALDLTVRHAYQTLRADPAAAAPALSWGDLHRLTGPGRRHSMGAADARPPMLRPGSQEHQQHPSRSGNRLRWPDGRLTDLEGRPLP